jgi:N6-L-threonylcarbamoyladenine synthase
MNILAIETSCDETAIAVLSVSGILRKTFSLKAHQIASQAQLHAQYGGVFPAMAKREHSRAIFPLFIVALKEAGLYKENAENAIRTEKLAAILAREPEVLEYFLKEIPKIQKPNIDRIAVTVGPGLTPALWVGISFAKALSYVWNIPLVPVNHMEGHILSVVVPDGGGIFSAKEIVQKLPAISLLVSGGHTEIVGVRGIGKYELLGQTRDDAVGEAFDKVARMLELPYPGGPHISRMADMARAENIETIASLPRPMLRTPDFDFSFSGLKTAILYLVRDLGVLTENQKKAIAREFEDAAVDVLVHKTILAAKKYHARSILVGGGVAANKELRSRLTEKADELGISIVFPTKTLSTDNAAMIALVGYFEKPAPIDSEKFIAQGNMDLR